MLILFRSKLIVWSEGKFEAKAQKQGETLVEECCSMTQIAFVRGMFVYFPIAQVTYFAYT